VDFLCSFKDLLEGVLLGEGGTTEPMLLLLLLVLFLEFVLFWFLY